MEWMVLLGGMERGAGLADMERSTGLEAVDWGQGLGDMAWGSGRREVTQAASLAAAAADQWDRKDR